MEMARLEVYKLDTISCKLEARLFSSTKATKCFRLAQAHGDAWSTSITWPNIVVSSAVLTCAGTRSFRQEPFCSRCCAYGTNRCVTKQLQDVILTEQVQCIYNCAPQGLVCM